jgi:hypothetical protein
MKHTAAISAIILCFQGQITLAGAKKGMNGMNLRFTRGSDAASSAAPSASPNAAPNAVASIVPSAVPSASPSIAPSVAWSYDALQLETSSDNPTIAPSAAPSAASSAASSAVPSIGTFNLPYYLSPLKETDERYARLNFTAVTKTYHPIPGTGNLKEFQIVEFTEEHDLYRLSNTSDNYYDRCGHWWGLAPEEGNCYDPTMPAVSLDQYRTNYIVCSEWNGGNYFVRTRIPKGSAFIVGIGQSVDSCNDHVTLETTANLQLYGDDVCDVDPEHGNDFCETNKENVYASSCVQPCSGTGRRALRGGF